jgi:hypothetical protein
MELRWTDVVVGPPTLGPAVFEIAPALRQRVRDWAAARGVAFAARHDVHWPAVEGWAVLDGGVTTVSGYGLTTLPHGVRVLGFAALRLLLADLGAAGPDEPFPGERPVDIAELRRRHATTPRDAPETIEQAELLAVCRDAELLRWVAATLYEEAARTGGGEPPPDPPPPDQAAGTTAEADAARRSARYSTPGSPSLRRKARSSPAIG